MSKDPNDKDRDDMDGNSSDPGEDLEIAPSSSEDTNTKEDADALPRDVLDDLLSQWQDDPSPSREADLWKKGLLPFIASVVKRWTFSRGLGLGHARDLAQEMACALLRRDRHALLEWDRSQAPARAFLRVVLWRRLSDGAKKARLFDPPEPGQPPEPWDLETPASLLERATQNAQLRDLIYDAATPSERDVYQLVYEEGLSLEEAAVRLKKSADAVAQRHKSLKERIKALLKNKKDR